MDTPAIIPLLPGGRPTEPGWYVVEMPPNGRQIVRLQSGPGGKQYLVPWGYLPGDPISPEVFEETVFIARIYPERIEGRNEG